MWEIIRNAYDPNYFECLQNWLLSKFLNLEHSILKKWECNSLKHIYKDTNDVILKQISIK